MKINFKPGGGNKSQPYIPAGNGRESGEYTTKSCFNKKIINKMLSMDCFLLDKDGEFNLKKSRLVNKVENVILVKEGKTISNFGLPNSVIKKVINGFIVSERYYNERGDAYLDIDYTSHGNPKRHPCVPHIHLWYYDEHNELIRKKWEEFK